MAEGRMLKRRRQELTLQVKNEVAERCNAICQLCGEIGTHYPDSGHVLGSKIEYTNPYDGTGAYRIPMEYDHIHPLFEGGSDLPDNLQILCRNCNRSKGVKTTSREAANVCHQ